MARSRDTQWLCSDPGGVLGSAALIGVLGRATLIGVLGSAALIGVLDGYEII